MDAKNLAIVRQSFAQTVFTHKVQEVAAENVGKSALWTRFANISAVAIALIMLLLQVKYPDSIIFSYIGSGITTGEIIFLIVQLSFNFEQLALSHKNSALKYMQLRDKYRALLVDIMNGRPPEELLARRDLLQQEYQIISDLAPQTGPKEYEGAQKRLGTTGIMGGEQYTWSSAEIDQFLPEELRCASS